MANKKSSQKDILTNRRNRVRNLQARNKVKSLFKQLAKAESSEKTQVQDLLSNIYKTLDSVRKQAINKSKANRLKSKACMIVKEKLGEKIGEKI